MEEVVARRSARIGSLTYRAIGLLVGTLIAGCAKSNPPTTTPTPPPAQSTQRVTDVFTRVAPASGGASSLADFQPDLPAVDGPFECTGHEERLSLAPNLSSLYASFPSRAAERATVTVLIDSLGKLDHYAERRGAPVRPVIPKGTDPAKIGALVAAAADSARSTTINLDFRRHTATVANRGGGRPNQSVSGPIDVIGSMEKFGKPLERAARVLAECNNKR